MNSAVIELRAAQVALRFGPAQVAEALDSFVQSRASWPTPTTKIPHPRTVAHQLALGEHFATDGVKLGSVLGVSRNGHPSWAVRFGINRMVSI